MTDKRKEAQRLFNEGYNCCQSVVGAFSESLGIERETALKLASSFGGGMARMREVCGAVTGMFIVLGLLEGYDEAARFDIKDKHYENLRGLAYRFRAENKSIICRELLDSHKDTDGAIAAAVSLSDYKDRPCAKLCGDAAALLEEYLADK